MKLTRIMLLMLFSVAMTASRALVASVAWGASPTDGNSPSVIIPVIHSMWRVHSNGQAEQLGFPPHSGNPDPIPAPDKKKIAFSREGNIWLFDLMTSNCKQLTRFSDPESLNFPNPLGWTKDSKALIYSVTANGDSEGPVFEIPLKKCKAVEKC